MYKKLIFTLMITTTLSPMAMAAATSGTCGKTYSACHWSLTNGVLTISGNGAMQNYDYNTFPWYSEKSSITSVVVQKGVTSIGDYAFYRMDGVTFITIPDSVKSIGRVAFCQIPGVTSITIPNSVTSIGDSAFYEMTGVKGTLTIPDSVTSIGHAAFRGMTGVTSLTIPNSVTSFEGQAFMNMTGVTGELKIPYGVTSIGVNTFANMTGVTSLTIPNSVTSIGKYAFNSMTGVTSLTIPDSVKSIGELAFYNMTGVTSLTIPDGASIGENAFVGVEPSTLTISASQLEAYLGTGAGGLKVGDDGKINIICTSGDCETYLKEKYKDDSTMLAALGLIDPNTVQGGDDGDLSGTGENQGGDVSGGDGETVSGGSEGSGEGSNEGVGGSDVSGNSDVVTPSATTRNIKRIYTVEEAAAVSKPTGNTFRLRYK